MNKREGKASVKGPTDPWPKRSTLVFPRILGSLSHTIQKGSSRSRVNFNDLLYPWAINWSTYWYKYKFTSDTVNQGFQYIAPKIQNKLDSPEAAVGDSPCCCGSGNGSSLNFRQGCETADNLVPLLAVAEWGALALDPIWELSINPDSAFAHYCVRKINEKFQLSFQQKFLYNVAIAF